MWTLLFRKLVNRVKTRVKADLDAKPNNSSPGQGIRSLDSTNIFRVANFELYVKPNKYVMGVGLAAIGCCVAYITYMNVHNPAGANQYVAIAEDGTQYIQQRTSKWD